MKAGLSFLFLLLATLANAQNCNCTHTVTRTGVYDGRVISIPPGSVVCIQAGTYEFLRFNNIAGLPDRPIRFINCGGLVDLVSDRTTSSGINFLNCQHFQISGTGDPGLPYGIRISRTGRDAVALNVLGPSSDFEIDHVEVAGAGFAGIMAKTDPRCDPATWRENFTMRNVRIHDNYVHDTKAEGLYIGHTSWGNGVFVTCNGVQRTVWPHEIYGLEIYNNLTERTGAEGIQYACSPDARVHHNTIRDAGFAPFGSSQNNGLQIGGGAGGWCYNNTVRKTGGHGIMMVGHRGPNYIYNNVVADAGTNGMYVDNRAGSLVDVEVVIANNTINSTGEGGIRLYNENNIVSVINNAITGVRNTAWYITVPNREFRITRANNFTATTSSAQYTDVVAYDFRPAPGSPLVNAGQDASHWGIITDIADQLRAATGAYDIGAYESGSPLVPMQRSGAVRDEQARLAAGPPLSETSTEWGIIYPSPCADQLTIRLQHHEQIRSVTILNVVGRAVAEHTAAQPANELTMPVGQLPAATYLLRVNTTAGKYTGRFLKQ